MGFSKEVNDRKSTTKLLNLRDAFPFYFNHMHYLDSNIPSKPFYVSVTGYFHPKMLLIDISIEEGFKNMWRVALQMPGPQQSS